MLNSGMTCRKVSDLAAETLDQMMIEDLAERGSWIWKDQDGGEHRVFGPDARAAEYGRLYGSIVPGPHYRKMMEGLGSLSERVDERVDMITLYSLIRLQVGTEAVALSQYYYMLYTA